MAQVGFQFHAAPDELLFELVQIWARDLPVFGAAEEFGGARVTFQGADASQAVGDIGMPSTVYLRLEPFVEMHERSIAFMRANPGFLAIQPGDFYENGLRESMIGSVTTDNAVLRSWRTVVRRARDSMQRGATR